MTSHIDNEVTEQMKHTVISTLCIIALAVMTLFIATSCNASVSHVPKQPGLHIDAGYGYKSDKEMSWLTGGILSCPPSSAKESTGHTYVLYDDEEDLLRAGHHPLIFRGNVIRIATRSMGWSYQEAEQVNLYPLSYQSARPLEFKTEAGRSVYYPEREAGYVCYQEDLRGVTVNESRPEKSYTYVEFRDIPESSTGYYLLCIDRGYFEPPKVVLLQCP